MKWEFANVQLKELKNESYFYVRLKELEHFDFISFSIKGILSLEGIPPPQPIPIPTRVPAPICMGLGPFWDPIENLGNI